MDNVQRKELIAHWGNVLCIAEQSIREDAVLREIYKNTLAHHKNTPVEKLVKTKQNLTVVNVRIYENTIKAERCRLELAFLKGELVKEDA